MPRSIRRLVRARTAASETPRSVAIWVNGPAAVLLEVLDDPLVELGDLAGGAPTSPVRAPQLSLLRHRWASLPERGARTARSRRTLADRARRRNDRGRNCPQAGTPSSHWIGRTGAVRVFGRGGGRYRADRWSGGPSQRPGGRALAPRSSVSERAGLVHRPGRRSESWIACSWPSSPALLLEGQLAGGWRGRAGRRVGGPVELPRPDRARRRVRPGRRRPDRRLRPGRPDRRLGVHPRHRGRSSWATGLWPDARPRSSRSCGLAGAVRPGRPRPPAGRPASAAKYLVEGVVAITLVHASSSRSPDGAPQPVLLRLPAHRRGGRAGRAARRRGRPRRPGRRRATAWPSRSPRRPEAVDPGPSRSSAST